MKQSSQHT